MDLIRFKSFAILITVTEASIWINVVCVKVDEIVISTCVYALQIFGHGVTLSDAGCRHFKLGSPNVQCGACLDDASLGRASACPNPVWLVKKCY